MKLITVVDAAKLYRVSESRLRNMIKQDALKPISNLIKPAMFGLGRGAGITKTAQSKLYNYESIKRIIDEYKNG
jgi:hypothetical protein